MTSLNMKLVAMDRTGSHGLVQADPRLLSRGLGFKEVAAGQLSLVYPAPGSLKRVPLPAKLSGGLL